MMGISEHYEFVVPKLPRKYDLTDGAADYLYTPGAATDDQWNGLFGSNPLSQWTGSQYGIGAGSHFDMVLKNAAGGYFHVAGDYLYRTQQSFQFDGGLWGIFRVTQ